MVLEQPSGSRFPDDLQTYFNVSPTNETTIRSWLDERISAKNHDAVNPNTLNEDGTPAIRVRLPKKWNREQFALAQLMMGANHIRVQCIDGVTRLGRIKGTMKKRTWIREGDTLIVTPWSFQDTKCDIIYRYLKPQTDWFKRNHYI